MFCAIVDVNSVTVEIDNKVICTHRQHSEMFRDVLILLKLFYSLYLREYLSCPAMFSIFSIIPL